MKRRILNEMLDMPLDESKKDANSRTVSCWRPLPDGEYCPAHATIDSVPSGLYEPHYNRDVNQVTLKKLPFTTDELYKLPSVEIQEILSDIQKFWDSKELYENYKFVHKRGILLYGEPGCGKSGIIQLCIRQIIELGGLVINVKDEDSVDYFIDFMPHFRNIEPNRPIVVILEDLEVEMPNSDIREAYLRAKLGDKVNDIDLVRWIKRTEDMSLSHLKELVISVFLLDKTFDDALALLEGMKVKPKVKKSGEKSIGFGSK